MTAMPLAELSIIASSFYSFTSLKNFCENQISYDDRGMGKTMVQQICLLVFNRVSAIASLIRSSSITIWVRIISSPLKGVFSLQYIHTQLKSRIHSFALTQK
jgi:hypothetical protein